MESTHGRTTNPTKSEGKTQMKNFIIFVLFVVGFIVASCYGIYGRYEAMKDTVNDLAKIEGELPE